MAQMDSRIPCTRSTRQLVKAHKTGGETYDELLQRMVEQYEPAFEEIATNARDAGSPLGE